MRLKLAKRVKSEFDEAVNYYGSVESEVGQAFRDLTQKLLLEISERPLRWRLISRRVRRCLYPRRFPYAIYYQLRSDHILVMTIRHTSRHPTYWRSRAPKK